MWFRNTNLLSAVVTTGVLVSAVVLCGHDSAGNGGGADKHRQFRNAVELLMEEIDLLQNTHKLSDSQLKYLTVAAKGAAKDHLRNPQDMIIPDEDLPDWAHGLEHSVRRRGGIMYLGDDASNQCLRAHPIWAAAVARVLTEADRNDEVDRRKSQVAFVADALLLAIDTQLRLTSDQRPQLRTLLFNLVTTQVKNIRCHYVNWMFLPVSEALNELPDDLLADILRDDQFESWQNLGPKEDLITDIGMDIPKARFAGGGGFF